MTYVVDEKCIKCKHMDCVEVCPVDCFYEGENMLVIHPDECIDCGVCEPECPVEAISSDTEDGIEKWAEINRKYSLAFSLPPASISVRIFFTVSWTSEALDFGVSCAFFRYTLDIFVSPV